MIQVLEPPCAAGQVPPEELGRAVAIKDVSQAVLWDHVFAHEHLVALSESVSASYPPPAPRGWYLPRVILEGGKLFDEEFDRRWGEWFGVVQSGHTPGKGDSDDAPEPGFDFRPYGGGRWARRYGDEPVAGLMFVDFVGQEEALRFWRAYLATVQETATAFTPATFDWCAWHFPLDDARNLFCRLSGVLDALRQATDLATLRESVRRFEVLLREADRLAGSDDVEVWFAGCDSEDDVPYWADRERAGRELEEREAERRRSVTDWEVREREEERAHREDPWLPAPEIRNTPARATARAGQQEATGAVPLRVPGFVSDFVDLCLKTAPYPNEHLAFVGGLATLAFLTSRKVRDASDVRPNLYALALARSGSGKEHVRKVVKAVLREAGLSESVVESVASAQGLEDALQARPSLLFLLDEADALLRTLASDRDPRLLEIHRLLLSLYSASSSSYSMRIKAGAPGATVDAPHLTLLGTAIPKHFFSALTERMLTNGLAGRMLVVDATGRRVGQRAKVIELPESIVEAARFWRDFVPANNDLNMAHASPEVIPSDADAEAVLDGFRLECERAYDAADSDAEAERTIHARTSEMARKLALLFAVSEAQATARITKAAAEWATAFARQQAAQMLELIGRYGATSPFEQGCRRVLELLGRAPGRRLSRSDLLKKLNVSTKQMAEWTQALTEREEIETKVVSTRGRAATFYCLLRTRSK